MGALAAHLVRVLLRVNRYLTVRSMLLALVVSASLIGLSGFAVQVLEEHSNPHFGTLQESMWRARSV